MNKIYYTLAIFVNKKTMSRGFVKEGDQEETPLVPPRAYLPQGAVNYVTKLGLEQLQTERLQLLKERTELQMADKDKNRVQINYVNAKLLLLDERINTAKLVNLKLQNKNSIHFGAIITVKEEGNLAKYQVVGVDEANLQKNKISYLSPIAKVLINKKVGDEIQLKTPKGNRKIIIENIEYK